MQRSWQHPSWNNGAGSAPVQRSMAHAPSNGPPAASNDHFARHNAHFGPPGCVEWSLWGPKWAFGAEPLEGGSAPTLTWGHHKATLGPQSAVRANYVCIHSFGERGLANRRFMGSQGSLKWSFSRAWGAQNGHCGRPGNAHLLKTSIVGCKVVIRQSQGGQNGRSRERERERERESQNSIEK